MQKIFIFLTNDSFLTFVKNLSYVSFVYICNSHQIKYLYHETFCLHFNYQLFNEF